MIINQKEILKTNKNKGKLINFRNYSYILLQNKGIYIFL